MKIRHLLMAISAAGMAAAPALAAPVASPAASLSLSQLRTTTPASHQSKLHGGTGIFILILGLAAIGGGIAAAVSTHSHPDSP